MAMTNVLCDDHPMNESIYWYDYETTGTDPARDRAIQFAGVRTDLDLNIISEPLDLICFPGNDTLPNPEALLVTGIDFSEIQKNGLNEADFIRQIHKEFSTPATCVAGFNSIRFDDEFSRHILYRNFYDPYAREWQNQNSRWDVIDLFRMAHALRPEGFEWPLNEKGTVTFRLELLTSANGIEHEDAHDAVSDVLATIGVARKLLKAQPKLYNFLFGLRHKREVIQQLYPLGKTPIIHVSSMYPASQACLAVVLPVCTHPTNANGIICFDLGYDPQPLIDLGSDELHRRLFTPGSELPADDRIHLKTIHVNRCPAVAPLSTLKGHEDRLGIDVENCLSNQKRLQQASGVVEKIEEVFSMTSFDRTEDPDLMLYQGDFFSAADKEIMAEIHLAPVERLPAFGSTFQDPRLPEMLFRYRARNFPDSLSESEKSRWDEYRRKIFSGPNSPDQRLEEISTLRASGRDAGCLDGLERYLLELKTELN